MVVGENNKHVTERINQLAGIWNVDPDHVRRIAIVGTAEQCAERLLPYVKLGVKDFLIGARPPADMETLELVAKKVAPLVKSAA